MASQKLASLKRIKLLPYVEEATFFKIIKKLTFSPKTSQSTLIDHNIPSDKENKYIHKGMIIFSLFIRIFFKIIAGLLDIVGSIVEYLLNCNIFSRKKDHGDGFISFLGKIDTRMELNKDIKHGDSRYYPALSMMASKLAYENEHVIDSTVSHRWKMEFVKFYNCYSELQKKPTTQAFIMREETAEDDKLIVAFRGTEPFNADDWITDFDFPWCKIDGIGKTHMGFMIALGLKKFDHLNDDDTCEFPKQVQNDPQRPLAYYTIRDKLKEIMANNERAKFIVTGHSLGGALAVLFPALLAYHGEMELLDKLEAIYTYGQPRVGNRKFGQFMKKSLRDHNIKYYRVVYGYDIVPELPFDNNFMTFKHFGTSIHFNSLYHAKIVEEEPVLTLLSEIVKLIIEFIPARLSAIWELIRGFIIGYTAGPYYREGWLLIALRCAGNLPGIITFVNHNPQDYVNATMLASQDLFKYYPALTS